MSEFLRIKTKHSVDDGPGRGAMSYAAPLHYEVVEQIPEEFIAKVVAFEVLIDEFSRSGGEDTITTVLYEKRRP